MPEDEPNSLTRKLQLSSAAVDGHDVDSVFAVETASITFLRKATRQSMGGNELFRLGQLWLVVYYSTESLSGRTRGWRT
ncbi:hypothetical protein Mapa_011385 [Marchantia paleacea]|nr:hypothetical protein Mapa_011385 [Marchantia paleacea]